MYNVGGSIIGLNDPKTKTIRFNSVFIGKQNVAQGYKTDLDVDKWFVTITLYNSNGSDTYELSGSSTAPYCSIDSNGVMTYNPTALENDHYRIDAYTNVEIKPFYTLIKVNCRAYSADDDSYESLTFMFRYGQIST